MANFQLRSLVEIKNLSCKQNRNRNIFCDCLFVSLYYLVSDVKGNYNRVNLVHIITANRRKMNLYPTHNKVCVGLRQDSFRHLRILTILVQKGISKYCQESQTYSWKRAAYVQEVCYRVMRRRNSCKLLPINLKRL